MSQSLKICSLTYFKLGNSNHESIDYSCFHFSKHLLGIIIEGRFLSGKTWKTWKKKGKGNQGKRWKG